MFFYLYFVHTNRVVDDMFFSFNSEKKKTGKSKGFETDIQATKRNNNNSRQDLCSIEVLHLVFIQVYQAKPNVVRRGC